MISPSRSNRFRKGPIKDRRWDAARFYSSRSGNRSIVNGEKYCETHTHFYARRGFKNRDRLFPSHDFYRIAQRSAKINGFELQLG